jgi:multidrug efflux system outer membrane protein
MPNTRSLLAAVAALAMTACSTAPDYRQPTAATPPAFKEAAGWQTAGTAVPPAGKWWQAFGDATLDGLEEQVAGGNFDLAAATARYEQARGLVRQARSDLYPEIGLGASAGRQRVSAGRPLSPTDSAATYSVATVGPSLDYEVDLFGRVRNSIRANTAAAQASEADVAGLRLGLQAQLATAYFDMRGLDARIVLLRETVTAFERAFRLTDTRHRGGIASGIDVSRAQSQLSSARAAGR